MASNFLIKLRTPKYYFTTNSQTLENTIFTNRHNVHVTSRDGLFDGCTMDFERYYNNETLLALRAKSDEDFKLFCDTVKSYDNTSNIKLKTKTNKTKKKTSWTFDSFVIGQNIIILRK